MLRLVILRFLESYFRHRWLWPLPVLAMIALAALSVVRTEPFFIARGALYVQKQSLLGALTANRDEGFTWVSPAQLTVNDFKELIQTEAFVRAIVGTTDLEAEMGKGPEAAAETIAEVRKAVWVQALGDNLVQVGAMHERPEVAQQLAAGTIEAYLLWKINDDQEESTAAQAFFTDLITVYRKDLDAARTAQEEYLRQHPDPVRGERPSIEQIQLDQLEAAVELAATRLKSALDKEENTRLSLATSESEVRQKYYVIDAPKLPEEPENSRRSAVMGSLIFVVVGVILAVVGVAGGALIDRTFRFPVDVRHAAGLPVIAAVPDVAQRDKAAKQPKGAAA